MATYDENFKKKNVKPHLEGGRTIRSLSDEFHISKNGISYWIKKYREECQTNPAANDEYDIMKENLRLQQELEEAMKIKLKKIIARAKIDVYQLGVLPADWEDKFDRIKYL